MMQTVFCPSKKCESDASIKMVIIDHITSPSALVFPVAELAKRIKRARSDVVIVIDGAHAPGQLNLELVKI